MHLRQQRATHICACTGRPANAPPHNTMHCAAGARTRGPGCAHASGLLGLTAQMSSAYSRMVLSDENLPLPAVYMMDLGDVRKEMSRTS